MKEKRKFNEMKVTLKCIAAVILTLLLCIIVSKNSYAEVLRVFYDFEYYEIEKEHRYIIDSFDWRPISSSSDEKRIYMTNNNNKAALEIYDIKDDKLLAAIDVNDPETFEDLCASVGVFYNIDGYVTYDSSSIDTLKEYTWFVGYGDNYTVSILPYNRTLYVFRVYMENDDYDDLIYDTYLGLQFIFVDPSDIEKINDFVTDMLTDKDFYNIDYKNDAFYVNTKDEYKNPDYPNGAYLGNGTTYGDDYNDSIYEEVDDFRVIKALLNKEQKYEWIFSEDGDLLLINLDFENLEDYQREAAYNLESYFNGYVDSDYKAKYARKVAEMAMETGYVKACANALDRVLVIALFIVLYFAIKVLQGIFPSLRTIIGKIFLIVFALGCYGYLFDFVPDCDTVNTFSICYIILVIEIIRARKITKELPCCEDNDSIGSDDVFVSTKNTWR